MKEYPSLRVVIFGYTPNTVSRIVGLMVKSAVVGFEGMKGAKLNSFFQGQIGLSQPLISHLLATYPEGRSRFVDMSTANENDDKTQHKLCNRFLEIKTSNASGGATE